MFSDWFRKDRGWINAIWAIYGRSQYIFLIIALHIKSARHRKRESYWRFIVHETKGWLSEFLIFCFCGGIPNGAVLNIKVSGIFANTWDKKYKNSPWAKVMNSKRTKACTNATNVSNYSYKHAMNMHWWFEKVPSWIHWQDNHFPHWSLSYTCPK